MEFQLVLLVGMISSVMLRSLMKPGLFRQIAQRELIYVKSSTPLKDVLVSFRRTRTPFILVVEDDQLTAIMNTDNIADVILIDNTRQV